MFYDKISDLMIQYLLISYEVFSDVYRFCFVAPRLG